MGSTTLAMTLLGYKVLSLGRKQIIPCLLIKLTVILIKTRMLFIWSDAHSLCFMHSELTDFTSSVQWIICIWQSFYTAFLTQTKLGFGV